MRVRCVKNLGADLPPRCLSSRYGVTAQTEFPLTIGEEYEVQAVTAFLGYPWFYIFDDDELPYPVWSPSPLFEVTDGALPRDWVYAARSGGDLALPTFIMTFVEWATDPRYYEKLVDGDAFARQVMRERTSAN